MTYVVLMPNEKGFDRFEHCVREGYGADERVSLTRIAVSGLETIHLPGRARRTPLADHSFNPGKIEDRIHEKTGTHHRSL